MIIFLRHGQAENNTKKILAGRTPGINLTEQGREQAEQAGAVSYTHLTLPTILRV